MTSDYTKAGGLLQLTIDDYGLAGSNSGNADLQIWIQINGDEVANIKPGPKGPVRGGPQGLL